MEQIYPLTEQHINAYKGMNVCAVMKTGFRQFGFLDRCAGDVVYLRSEFIPVASISNDVSVQHQHMDDEEQPGQKNMQQSQLGKKRVTDAKKTGSARSKAALSTNYAQGKHIPSSNISAASDKNVAKIELNDIVFLLLLV